MNDLFRLRIIGSTCLATLIPFSVHGDSPTITERPNVIVIISDDQGWADIGYNNPKVYTPHLDKLANAGATFPPGSDRENRK